MISVQEALSIIEQNIVSLKSQVLPVSEVGEHILAEDIHSPIDLPGFAQSAMDGYAFAYKDYLSGNKFTVVGEVPAGSTEFPVLHHREAYRIFTGAPLPHGATAVVMQEKTELEGNILIVKDEEVEEGHNIRPAGSQIKTGQPAMSKGTLLTPGAVGFLASMGYKEVKVSSNPKVTVLITGNELIKPGMPLKKGQVYESNSFALKAALYNMGIGNVQFVHLQDNLESTVGALEEAFRQSDLILGTGGISVGKYDFVGKALEQLGVKTLFYKVAQKPGKPLYFGKKDDKIVFALPGNPGAVLSCFYMYVYPAIKIMQGSRNVYLKKLRLPLSKKISKKNTVAGFLKARLLENKVEPLFGQESYIISSFAAADSIIYVPRETEKAEEGELVDVYLLPV